MVHPIPESESETAFRAATSNSSEQLNFRIVEGNDPLVARVEALQNFPKPVIAGKWLSYPEVIRQVELRPKRLAPLESLKLTQAIPFPVVRW